MKTVIEKITPELAEEYLARVDAANQRKPKKGTIDAYAREMLAGHWYPNHQGIGFDMDGNLIDGQQRLAAIKQAGISVPMLVTRGIENYIKNGVKIYAIDAIDIGRKREVGEQLSFRHNIKNSNRVAAAARGILVWAADISKCTVPTTLEIIRLYPEIIKVAEYGKHRVLPGSAIGMFAIALKTFPHLAESFIEPYVSGAGLTKKSPALLLRNILLNNPQATRGGWGSMRRLINWSLNAAKAFAMQDEIKILRDHSAGAEFFRSQQKNLIKKIRLAAGLTETTTQEEK